MAKIRLTKEFCFEAAHALEDYNGACRHIHGHSYRLFVTVLGEPISDASQSSYGMVLDFGDLKRIVNEQIVSRLDHALVLRRSPLSQRVIDGIGDIYSNILLTDYQPTCENMLVDFAQRISLRLPCGVELYSLKLHETATSFAEWYAIDNEIG
ncbi:MAG: 6-carboxytetrahydropterin synthase [Rikenellaceae bacterium]